MQAEDSFDQYKRRLKGQKQVLNKQQQLTTCIEYKEQSNYWSFEVCLESHVQQFHVAADQSLSIDLGRYSPTDSSAIKQVYIGGDSCRMPHKESQKRQTEISIECCVQARRDGLAKVCACASGCA